MSSIVKSIGDLIGSFFELVGSIFQTAFNLVKGVFEGAFKFIETILASILDVVKGAVHAAGGLGKFVAGEQQMSSLPTHSLFLTDHHH